MPEYNWVVDANLSRFVVTELFKWFTPMETMKITLVFDDQTEDDLLVVYAPVTADAPKSREDAYAMGEERYVHEYANIGQDFRSEIEAGSSDLLSGTTMQRCPMLCDYIITESKVNSIEIRKDGSPVREIFLMQFDPKILDFCFDIEFSSDRFLLLINNIPVYKEYDMDLLGCDNSEDYDPDDEYDPDAPDDDYDIPY
jgi:hypothetical protein